MKTIGPPELKAILGEYFKGKGFVMQKFEINNNVVDLKLLPVIKKGEFFTTVNVFLGQIEKVYEIRDKANFNWLKKFFSEGQYGKTTFMELLDTNPENLLKHHGFGKKRIEFFALVAHRIHVSSFVKRCGNVLSINQIEE